MRKNDIYKEIVSDIAERLLRDGIINQDEHEGLIVAPFELDDILSHGNLGIYLPFLTKVREEMDSEDDVVNENWTFVYKNYLEKLPYHFVDISSKAYVVTAKFVQEQVNKAGVPFSDEFWLFVTQLYVCKHNGDDISQFWNVCKRLNSREYFIISNIDNNRSWSVYAYAVLNHLNISDFSIDPAIAIARNTPFSGVIDFDESVPYEQYFDIYAIIGEAKHAQDILTRFLKMYHILELMTYRIYLVKIANVSMRKNAFVRKVLSKAKDGVNKEEEVLKTGMKTLFPALRIIYDAECTENDAQDALKKIYEDEAPSLTENKIETIVKVIYKIRNSIVHNKESELHFSYGNIEEYKDIIPLIKNLSKLMEGEIIKKISAPTSELIYKKKTLPLY